MVIMWHLFCTMYFRIWKMKQEPTTLLWLPLWASWVLFGIQQRCILAYRTSLFYEEGMIKTHIIKRGRTQHWAPSPSMQKCLKSYTSFKWCISRFGVYELQKSSLIAMEVWKQHILLNIWSIFENMLNIWSIWSWVCPNRKTLTLILLKNHFSISMLK